MTIQLPVWRRNLRCLLGVLCASTQLAQANVAITELVVDGQAVPTKPAGKSAVSPEAIRIKSSARELQFHFRNDDPAERPCLRLRYKLEGLDDHWRDLPTRPRILVRFFDRMRQVIGSETYAVEGETPDWRGAVETSRFVPRQERMVVPERAASLLVSILSDDPCIGVLGVDEMRVTLQPRAGGPPKSFDLSAVQGTDLSVPLGTPSNWMREGSRAELAQLCTLPTPVPHSVLVIYDDDRARYGNWALRPEKAVPVKAGERVALAWKTAHSLGGSGPGVASFGPLPPGNYWFRVAAVKANGDPTGLELSMPVLVVVPLYERAEFWLILLAATLAGLALFSRYVTQRRMQRRLEVIEREQALERERARIARDLHDEIGAGLTAIAMQSDWVRREIAALAPPDTQRRMDAVCQSAVELTRSVDEIVWAVNPVNDTLDRFVNYLTQSAEQFLDAAGLPVRFDIPAPLPSAVLPGKARHFLFLCALEALNNAVKHARASLLRLAVRVENERLKIIIEDNGCGFSERVATQNGTHEGLNNMRHRMAEIAGEFTITAKPGKGTRVELALALTGETIQKGQT